VEISEIRIKLMDEKESRNERLLAFCSVTFNNMFVVRDLKIIEGTKGMFVAMPSRKLTDRCTSCSSKNHLRARFCNQCGARLNEDRAPRDMDGRARLHADVAHPINSSSREFIQGSILRSYSEEVERAKQPGYVCRYEEFDAGDYDPGFYEQTPARAQGEFHKHSAHEPRASHAARSVSHSQTQVPAGNRGDENRPQRNFGSGVFD
jgi:stage V sporulation protein G